MDARYVIATDEAGYGPKLGPLVIAATVWEIRSAGSITNAFDGLASPFTDCDGELIRIDDSKKIFRPASRKGQLLSSPLDRVCGLASRWCGLPSPHLQLTKWLQATAPADLTQAVTIPWFKDLAMSDHKPIDAPEHSADASVVAHWSSLPCQLKRVHVRWITASAFNQLVNRGYNKADILTESTCDLVRRAMECLDHERAPIHVYSDRHGGRSRYGAALQHVFADAIVKVVNETSRCSEYELNDMNSLHAQWAFTVSGDSFSPVAMSSLIAKWLRERSMAMLNDFFQSRLPTGGQLARTAGYPVDADRYLRDLDRLGIRTDISNEMLVRLR